MGLEKQRSQRGAIHIHSRYSDGEFTLAELREVFLRVGCSFICMTDHAESFDSAKLASYVNECRSLSDADCVLLPGIEYACEDRIHIIGYGCTRLANSRNPQEVIAMIQGEGGLAVVAHPSDAAFATIESFSAIPNGIEVWNTKYDGQYAPRPQVFQLLYRLQQKKSKVWAFYGLDLHWKKQFRQLLILLECAEATPQGILTALGTGKYTAVKGELSMKSDGNLPEATLEQFLIVHKRSDRLRRWMTASKRVADRLGIKVPPAVRSQLRRIF